MNPKPHPITPEESNWVTRRAYVPEHIPSLMVPVSKAKAFLCEDYIGYFRDNWVILVGYPMKSQFSQAASQRVIEAVQEAYHPEHLWYIGIEIPQCLAGDCIERGDDWYYLLELDGWEFKAAQLRSVRRASRELRIGIRREFGGDHQQLVGEIMADVSLPPLVAELYRSMPEYISASRSGVILEARDGQGKLSAFLVVDRGAQAFDTYVLGGYSRENYVPNASDALFARMIDLARDRGKRAINLGLGVNEGIRRFKTKWGGEPALRYEYCGCRFPRSRIETIIEMLQGGKL